MELVRRAALATAPRWLGIEHHGRVGDENAGNTADFTNNGTFDGRQC
jgi:hypothetical protein